MERRRMKRETQAMYVPPGRRALVNGPSDIQNMTDEKKCFTDDEVNELLSSFDDLSIIHDGTKKKTMEDELIKFSKVLLQGINQSSNAIIEKLVVTLVSQGSDFGVSVLPEKGFEELWVEKTVDKIKLACQAASRRITSSMQGSGSDFEKRLAMLFQKSKGSHDDIALLWRNQSYSDIMKKLNQAGLANSMLESSSQLGETSLLGSVLCGAGEAELFIAKQLCEYEMSVEKNVLVPMTSLLENEIPNLSQAKKKLSKAALDMDTCRSRWMAAVKAAHGSSKDMQSAASKADSLKDEFDDGIIKFESCQDSFTTEALEFVSREGEYADWIIKFMEAQLEYHRTASDILGEVLPSMKTKVDESSLRPVFGCPLEEHLKAQNRTIAFVLEECLMYIHDGAIDEQPCDTSEVEYNNGIHKPCDTSEVEYNNGIHKPCDTSEVEYNNGIHKPCDTSEVEYNNGIHKPCDTSEVEYNNGIHKPCDTSEVEYNNGIHKPCDTSEVEYNYNGIHKPCDTSEVEYNNGIHKPCDTSEVEYNNGIHKPCDTSEVEYNNGIHKPCDTSEVEYNNGIHKPCDTSEVEYNNGIHKPCDTSEGLFRMAGSAGRVRKLKAAFDAGLVDLAEYAVDVHAITGVVKLYLRELPDPLMMFQLYDEWIKAASIKDNGAKLQAYWVLVEKLSKENKDNLRYLICFLAKVSEYSDINKMTASNIAIVIAPNIVYSETATSDGVHLQHSGIQSSIVESLIVQHKYFFPEGVDFFRSIPSPDDHVNSSSSSHTKQPLQQKRSVTDFQSVTGGLLEEVVGMINSSGSADKETSRTNRGNSPTQALHSNNNSSSQASSVHVMSYSGTTGTEKKRQAPSPGPALAQVKYLGSVSPVSTSPPLFVAKPTAQPPAPPSKPSGAPPLAPKPDLKK
ncbi:hypothetical protein QZH41_011602 [Actinostola sp. cb2023]|nr:hypothetical protein QZH41_011602 [Actinostola sp. cb2023]